MIARPVGVGRAGAACVDLCLCLSPGPRGYLAGTATIPAARPTAFPTIDHCGLRRWYASSSSPAYFSIFSMLLDFWFQNEEDSFAVDGAVSLTLNNSYGPIAVLQRPRWSKSITRSSPGPPDLLGNPPQASPEATLKFERSRAAGKQGTTWASSFASLR